MRNHLSLIFFVPKPGSWGFNLDLLGPWSIVLNFYSAKFTNSAEEKFSRNGKIFQRQSKNEKENKYV